ncbi:hypothetical protein BOX15_Mlig012485g1, partial [Macrostomum lignano]
QKFIMKITILTLTLCALMLAGMANCRPSNYPLDHEAEAAAVQQHRPILKRLSSDHRLADLLSSIERLGSTSGQYGIDLQANGRKKRGVRMEK